MALESPVTAAEWVHRGGGRQTGSGKPRTTDPATKHFERRGYTIIDAKPNNLGSLVRRHDGKTAFRLAESGTIDEGLRTGAPIGVYAESDADVSLRLGPHFSGGNRLFTLDKSATGWGLRNIEIDATRDGRGARIVTAFTGGTARNVNVTGEIHDNDGDSKGFACAVPRGETIELLNYRLPDGASRTWSVPSPSDKQGVIMTSKSDGVLKMKNCEVGGFPSNGVYASGPGKRGNDGKAIIEGHVGYNSDRDQLRVGNESVIRDSTLYTDRLKPGFNCTRGVWSRYARGVRIENTSIKTHHTDFAPAIYADSTAGETTIKNCDVELRSPEKSARGVTAMTPSSQAGDDNAVHIEDTHFHGDGSPRNGILVLGGRPGTTIQNCEFDLPNVDQLIDNRS